MSSSTIRAVVETLDASHPLLSVLRTRQFQRLFHSGGRLAATPYGLPPYFEQLVETFDASILSFVSFERPNSSPSSIAAVVLLQHPTYEHIMMLELLKKGHMEAERKICCGVKSFQVRFHPQFKVAASSSSGTMNLSTISASESV